MRSTIYAVQVITTEGDHGSDSSFVAVHGKQHTGWYGPVSTEIGRHVDQRISQAVVGGSVMDHRGLQKAMRMVTVDLPAPVASWAVGAVDCAAWDLHGQLVQAPVAGLLADFPRRFVPLYASWLSLEVVPSVLAAAAQEVSSEGWQFTKWGLRRDPARDIGSEAVRLTATTAAVASVLGCSAAFDAVFTWTAALADLVAELIDPADVLWLEDPLPCFDAASYRSLAARAPVAFGERLLIHDNAQTLLDMRPRAFTLDVVACGGLTRAVDLVAAARSHGIQVYPHGRSFVPAVHLAAAYPDAIPAVEYRLQWEPSRQHQYLRPCQPAEGRITVPVIPGLGTTPRSN